MASFERDIAITVADVGARCTYFYIPLEWTVAKGRTELYASTADYPTPNNAIYSPRAHYSIGGKLYDILAFEAGLHAFLQHPADWFTLSYYIIDAIMSRSTWFWDLMTSIVVRFFWGGSSGSDSSSGSESGPYSSTPKHESVELDTRRRNRFSSGSKSSQQTQNHDFDQV
jgi:hypothetical protein